MDKNFDIIITGVGGQGVITLISLIDEAARIQGLDVRSSELHGLSQRGGSVEAHIRFGKKVLSPLVFSGKADLIFALELLEGLREISKSSKNTKLLVNDFVWPLQGGLPEEEVKNRLTQLKNQIFYVPASKNCKDKLQSEVVGSIFLLGYGIRKGIIPLKEESVLKAIENVIPEKYRDLNIKAFELSKNDN